MVYIIVGSLNPVKLAAVQAVLQQVFPQTEFGTQAVPSGVRDQPWGDAETYLGAYNRAKAVLAHTKADIGVGLEGGVQETQFGLMTCAWCAILARDGKIGLGGGANMLLPPSVEQALRSGQELGHAMDTLINGHNTKQKMGAIGILTDGLLDRQQAYENIVMLAVAPFRQPNYYKGV